MCNQSLIYFYETRSNLQSWTTVLLESKTFSYSPWREDTEACCTELDTLSPFRCCRNIESFRERFSNQWGKAYAIMPKVIMGNGGFSGCLSELQDISACWKETALTHASVLSRSLLIAELP